MTYLFSPIIRLITNNAVFIERISSNFNFEWTKFEFSKNRNMFESLRSNFKLSRKRAFDISQFHLVPRGVNGYLA